MIELSVPTELGPEIVVRYGGDDPRTYAVVDGRVAIEERFLDDFLALFPGASVAPSAPAAPAKPAEELAGDAKPASEEK